MTATTDQFDADPLKFFEGISIEKLGWTFFGRSWQILDQSLKGRLQFKTHPRSTGAP
jgi:hypothetical protein